ncbi:ABC transporter substrate-binding protein [Ketogulonicigenium vulgare]|uniref:ABC transporter substrate-binding protein n=1 Tax=Ketogulonicigenium vulgare TaxID=92945 RepID=UPI0023586BB5|nr:extracellular solute-binding protein [Ketogulonicigenium vulgare]
MSNTTFTRRELIALGGMAAALGITGLPKGASAQEKGRIVASILGGDYAELLRRIVDERVMIPAGYEVLQDISTTEARQTKLRTERTRRESSFDVGLLADLDMYPMAQIGVLEDLDESKVPNIANVIPALRKPYAVPQLFSYIAIVYNPAKITTPPTSYNDLWNPEYKGKVGISDVLYVATSAAASLAAGGSMSDYTPGREKLLALKNEQQVKILPTNERIAAAFQSEEIWITLNYVARGFGWRKAGLNLDWSIPQEGAIPVTFEFAVPKNAPNKEGAYAYLNAALEPDSQLGFLDSIGYLPSVTNAVLPPEIAAQVQLTPEQQANMKPIDNAYFTANQADIFDFWTREFKG